MHYLRPAFTGRPSFFRSPRGHRLTTPRRKGCASKEEAKAVRMQSQVRQGEPMLGLGIHPEGDKRGERIGDLPDGRSFRPKPMADKPCSGCMIGY